MAEEPYRRAVSRTAIVYGLTCKVIELFFTVITFLLLVVPSPPIIGSDHIFCSENPDDHCMRFMLYPIALSSLMVAILAPMLLFSCKGHVMPAWIDCIISFLASLAWIAATIVIGFGTVRLIRGGAFDKMRKFNVGNPTAAWIAAIPFGAMLGVTHMADSWIVNYYSCARGGSRRRFENIPIQFRVVKIPSD